MQVFSSHLLPKWLLSSGSYRDWALKMVKGNNNSKTVANILSFFLKNLLKQIKK